MNTRIPFLIVALLVGACCAARCQDIPEPVLAVQRCFPQATVRPLPEVRYNGEIVPPRTFIQVSISPGEAPTISADGRRLFFRQALDTLGRQSYFVDLATGEVSLAKMPDQQLKLDEDWGLPYIVTGVWDPVEPAYLYVRRESLYIDNDGYESKRSGIWRINAERLMGQQILPLDGGKFLDITPDGRYLLVDGRDSIQQHPLPYLYSLETHTWTPLLEDMAGMRYTFYTYAPNGELLAGFTHTEEWENTVLTIKDLTTGRLAPVFNPDQALLSRRLFLIGTPRWLPDSSGLLVNASSIEGNILNTIWQVDINEQTRPIATGAAVIANSQNGRHWLLLHERQLYLMTVDDTAPEE